MDITAIAGAGMKDDLLRLSGISQNIANVTTAGYKKQVSVPHSFAAQVGMLDDSQLIHGAHAASFLIDPSAGPLRPTGNASDVAIEGNGFLEISTPSGPVYTRHGAIRISAEGVLIGAQGMPVMGSGGPIRLINAPFAVGPNGDIEQNGRVVGRIKLVQFEKPALLLPLGNGLYEQGGARVVEKQGNGTFRSGFLESSNVSSPQEMVHLSETVRHFESLQKIVQGYDDSLEKAIRKLGEF